MLPELDRVYRARWESLLAVDEMVADVVGSLDRMDLLDNTYVLFTSDNGYHVGELSGRSIQGTDERYLRKRAFIWQHLFLAHFWQMSKSQKVKLYYVVRFQRRDI